MQAHQPVLLEETLEQLNIQADGLYVDATFGRGGHSRGILQRLDANGQLLAMDKDPAAIAAAENSELGHDPRFHIHQGSFTQLHSLLQLQGALGKVRGILFDLGVSSPQLDEAERGFSFLKEGPLDMRMDPTQSMDAARWLNTASEQEIYRVIKEYGEERFAGRIAAAIHKARSDAAITTTMQLAEIISAAHPRWEPHKHPATRSFQGIRIYINQELTELTAVLPQCLEALAIGGRLLVISFHSLEDRIVKDFIETYGSTAQLPRGLPFTAAQLSSNLRIKRINGAIKPSPAEVKENPRARSAKLRVIEKIA